MGIVWNISIIVSAVLFSGLVLLAIAYVLFNVIIPFLYRGTFYVPSKDEKIKKMLAMAQIKPGERVVDLGSGDGRIVMALAQAGAEAHGYEINLFLVILSRMKIKKAHLSKRAFIHWTSFWNVNYSKFDVMIIYGMDYIMKNLEEKLQRELKTGARVLSNAFTFPTWKPAEKNDNLYLYKK
jgi:cyclopropane fatty-acyl-phospholipid synthase-like methyltransferase